MALTVLVVLMQKIEIGKGSWIGATHGIGRSKIGNGSLVAAGSCH